MRNSSELKRAIGAMNITHQIRIHAVNMALDPNFDRKNICKTFGISEKTFRNWLDWFEAEGVDGLRHKEGAGRPSDVPLDKIKRYCKKLCKRGKLTVKKLIRTIRRNDKRLYSGSHARRLIRTLGHIYKMARTRYDYASSPEECAQWQKKNISKILRLQNEGYTVLSADESMAVNIVRPGRIWQNHDSPLILQKSGRHEKTVLLGAIAGDGSHLIIQDDRANSKTFIRLLRLVHAKYGKCVIILDNAKYHTSKMVERYIKSTNGDVIPMFLPTGAPHLNAIEECWRQTKQELMTGTYYDTIENLKDAITKYLRAKTFKLNLFTYLYRTLEW